MGAQVVLLIIRPFAISPFIQTKHGENLVNDATLACAPALLLFFVPSSVRPGQALLTWPAVHEKFDFGLLLLIGGSLAINTGFTESGLNIAMGNSFAQLVPHMGTFALNLAVIVCVTLCVQVFSGIGIAATLLPVISSAALQAVVNPLLLLLPATMASSFAFLLPTATPSNVVVLAKSQDLSRSLRFRDFFWNGLPLTLAIIVVGALLTDVMGALVFDSHSPFPQWACSASPASCVFMQAPGIVQGQQVEAQACIVDLGSVDTTMCRLWNGTMLDMTLVPRVY